MPTPGSLHDDSGMEEGDFHVVLPRRVVLAIITGALGFAFSGGLLGGKLLLKSPTVRKSMAEENLPVPVLSKGKTLPNATYSSKFFGMDVSNEGETLLAQVWTEDPTQVLNMSNMENDGGTSCSDDDECEDAYTAESEHEPAGQHLLVDMRNIDSDFLDSKVMLSQSMVSLVRKSDLTLLSYHCHRLEPAGVSCVGVLLESHVSFHTWPSEGVITLDLFTCGEGSLLPFLPLIGQLFGVPKKQYKKEQQQEEPQMRWSYKYRGFRSNTKGVNPQEFVDMNQYMMGWMEYDMKNRIANEETEYQTVEIYEILKAGLMQNYRNSLTDPTSYEAQHKELFQPDRVIYLDGIMQSRFYGEAAYHEALVHPGMMAHDHPKRVAIVGGGEGATLREILKHKTVEMVTMVEIDEEMVQLSRKYIPEWSDCSNLKGSVGSCFEDSRAEVFYADAIAWFIDRFGDGRGKDEDKYDVIIMDALDPSASVAFSDILYNNAAFAEAVTNALNEDGIIIAQIGEAPSIDEGPAHMTNTRYVRLMMEHFSHCGFLAAKEYSEAHGGFMGIWDFLVFFKDINQLGNWYANQASVDVKISKRIIDTVDGSSPLRFFDGSNMVNYQYPGRTVEEVFCRKESGHKICDPATMKAPQEIVTAIMFEPLTTSTVQTLGRTTNHSFFRELITYIQSNSMVSDLYEAPGYHFTDSPQLPSGTEGNDTSTWGQHIEHSFYNPFIDRNHFTALK